MKALVGPDTNTRLPPSAEERKPPTMEANNPCKGETPIPIAIAIAKGKARIPAVRPAIKSFFNVLKEYPCFKQVTNLGIRCLKDRETFTKASSVFEKDGSFLIVERKFIQRGGRKSYSKMPFLFFFVPRIGTKT